MDFSNFSLREAAEKPRAVHLEMDGKPLFVQSDNSISGAASGKPCRVLIRGAGSEAVSTIIREIERLEMVAGQRFGRAKDKELDGLAERHQTAMRDAMRRLIHAAVASFENIIFDGQPVEASSEYIDRLCVPRTVFFGQVYEAILEQDRFLDGAAKG